MKQCRSAGRIEELRNWLKAVVVAVLVLIFGFAAFLSARPSAYVVTGDVWAESVSRAEVPPSFAEFNNNVFNATVSQPSTEFFGVSLIQQGDSPHGWWNLTESNPKASLKREVTIYKEGFDMYPPLVLDFVGKRTSSIEWFTDNQSNRGNNIGILLVGDIGQGYYDPDTSKPRALFIDIWLDANPEVKQPQNWTGVNNVENDYHSGFPVGNMSEIGMEYHFNFRIDTFVVDALRHWNLESFTLKMIQCYIEAKASRASVEVNRVLIYT
jgi:hypothetical protein